MVMDILLKQLIIQPNAVSKTPTETEHLKAFMVINLSKLQIFLWVSWSNFNEYLIQMCMLQYIILGTGLVFVRFIGFILCPLVAK